VSAQNLPLPVHDGSTGNLVQRAEPKVKAASIAALLTPLALYYLYRYAPGVSSLPHELDVVLATLVTGGATFAAGFAARAVDRIDLFVKPYAEKAQQAADRALGAPVVDELEAWAKDIAAPVKAAAVDAVHAVEAAAEAGHDPLQAVEEQAPKVAEALGDAVADGRAEAGQAAGPVAAELAADAPALVADVTAAPTSPKTAEELMAELRKMIALLDAGTPIADAAQAQTAPADPPAADPPTAPLPAVPAAPATA
jgi:hypothetical protein